MQIPCEEIPCDEGRLQQQNRAANRKMSETEFPSKINQTEEFKKEAEQKLEQVPENMHMDQKNFTILKQASHDSSVDYGDLERGKPSDTQSEGGKGDAAAEKCSSTPDIIVPSCPRTEDHGDHTNTEQNSSRITDVEKMDETKPLAVNEDAGRGSHNDRAMKLDEKVITEDKNKSDRQKEGNSMKEDSHRQEMSKGISVLEIDPPHVTRKIENKEMKNAQLSSCEDNIFISTIDVDGNEKEKLVETNVNAISDEHINVQNNNASGGRVGEAHLSDVHLNLSKYYEFHYADKETLVNNHPDPNNNYGSESLHKEQPSDKANHESTQFMMGSRELDLRTEKLEKYIDSNERSEVLQKINAKENQIVQKNLNNQNYEPNSEEGESIVNQSSMNEENLHNLLLDEVPIQHNMDKSEMHPELRIEKKESVKGNANKNEETEKMASTIKQNEGPEMLCAKQGYEILEKDIASGKFLIPVTGKDSFEEGDTETHVCTSCTSLKDIVDSHSDKNENRKEDSKDRSEDTRQEREREDICKSQDKAEAEQQANTNFTNDGNDDFEGLSMENPQDLKLDKEPPDSPTVEVEIAASTDPVMDNPWRRKGRAGDPHSRTGAIEMHALVVQSFPPTLPFPRPSSFSRQRPSNQRQALGMPPGLPSSTSDDDVKTLIKVKSRDNDIQVVEVSRRADQPLAGARLLLLDVFATLPPLLPPGATLALLGFGADSAARLLLHHFPGVALHGYELDPAVLSVSRDLLGLRELEELHGVNLVARVGDALEASAEGAFAGMAVDLFSRGSVVRELQEEGTWEALRGRVRAREGGRVMVNCGGSSVENEEGWRRGGGEVARETPEAMWEVFLSELMVLNVGEVVPGENSYLAMTGGPVRDAEAWKRQLPLELTAFVL